MKIKHILLSTLWVAIIWWGIVFMNLGISDKCSADNPNCHENEQSKQFTNKSVQLFSDNALEKSIENWRIPALYFKANWCLNCKLLEEELKEKGFPDWIDIYEVDFDQAQDLRKQYLVNNQHTLLLLNKEKKEIWRDISWNYNKVIETIKKALE